MHTSCQAAKLWSCDCENVATATSLNTSCKSSFSVLLYFKWSLNKQSEREHYVYMLGGGKIFEENMLIHNFLCSSYKNITNVIYYSLSDIWIFWGGDFHLSPIALRCEMWQAMTSFDLCVEVAHGKANPKQSNSGTMTTLISSQGK